MTGVQCCDISHDENVIVSCDVSSCIKVSNCDIIIVILFIKQVCVLFGWHTWFLEIAFVREVDMHVCS